MSISSNIIESITSAIDTPIEQLKSLLIDLYDGEINTIHSYNEFLIELRRKFDSGSISINVYNSVLKSINHINDEEKEHAKELEVLQDLLDI